MEEKSPLEVMDAALEQYMQSKATGSEAMIEEAFKKIKPLTGPPSVGIEAFRAIVLALINEFPGQGYERWQPPLGKNKRGTGAWHEMVRRIEQYWSDNTGFRD